MVKYLRAFSLRSPTFTMKISRVLVFAALALAIASPVVRAQDDDDEDDVSDPECSAPPFSAAAEGGPPSTERGACVAARLAPSGWADARGASHTVM